MKLYIYETSACKSNVAHVHPLLFNFALLHINNHTKYDLKMLNTPVLFYSVNNNIINTINDNTI